jgi:thiol-disulfide isomerase/thioredoxin
MKKLILAAVVVATFAFNACKKDVDPEIITVSTEHKSFQMDFTANWCGPCGSYKEIFQDVEHHFPHKLVVMEIHASNDSFHVPAMYNYWANVYDVTGIPTIIQDNRRVSWGWVAPTFELDTSDFYHLIDSTTSSPTPCGIGLAKSISGNTMTIKSKVVFFDSYDGEFTLAIYVVEDDLYFEQNGTSDWYHDNVFRACVNDPQGVGTTLINGSVSKGTTFDQEFTYTIPADFVQSNLHIIGVVYEMGTQPKPIAIMNANKI